MFIASKKAVGDNTNISFYTGTFDVIDKEGDVKTTLFGIEHKNLNLFRDTFLGKFKPVSGGFMTGDSSIYLYTGIELSLIHISEPTRLLSISYAVFCLKKKSRNY